MTRRPGESPRQQSVCIEIPVSVHGSRSASGNLNNSQAAKPFLEETRTMIVFPQGAVLRLTEPVSEGQILILKNPRVKQEVACRVVSSKTNASAKGYIEVEFFQAAPGFWGITFPSVTSSASSPAEPKPVAAAPIQPRVEPSAAKPAFFQPPPVAPSVVTPKPVAPVAPVISIPAPVPTPVISVAVAPEPPAPAPIAAKPFVAAPIISEPIVPAPVAAKPTAPVMTPDSTQELNAAIAAAYRTQVEPVKPVKMPESAQEVKPVKESVPVSAPPSPSIIDSVPSATNKQVNPSKPKSAPSVKASPEPISSEPLAMAESIGYPSSEFSSQSKSGKSSKQSRSSATASSSSIETRKVELTSSQIASEAVLGKPMFGSGTDASSNQKFGSSSTWIIAVGAAFILAGGAGSYWWFSSHKLGATKSNTVSAAAPVTPPSTAPVAAVAPPLAGPAGTTSQPSNSVAAKPNSTANQKPSSVPNAAPANSLVAKTDKTSASVDSRRPTVLPSEKIAAPVTHTDNSSIVAMPAPDVVSKTSNAPGASLSSILPGMGQPSSAPAPPPSRPAGPPAAASTLQQPKLIQSESPVYPKIAATRGDWGDVIVDATIGENGKVADARVVSGPETLRQSALQVVRTQTYQPAKLNGKPVSMHVMVKVPFPKPR
jgi:TonB family protein